MDFGKMMIERIRKDAPDVAETLENLKEAQKEFSAGRHELDDGTTERDAWYYIEGILDALEGSGVIEYCERATLTQYVGRRWIFNKKNA